MSDKLLIEIDMFNGELNDAIPALVYLAHELAEGSVIEFTQPIDWNEKTGNAYQVKWRFSEDEIRIPFDLDSVQELSDELEKLSKTISEKRNSAIVNFQSHLRRFLDAERPDLFAEAY